MGNVTPYRSHSDPMAILQSKDWRGLTYPQPLLLRSEISLFWCTSCSRYFLYSFVYIFCLSWRWLPLASLWRGSYLSRFSINMSGWNLYFLWPHVCTTYHFAVLPLWVQHSHYFWTSPRTSCIFWFSWQVSS